MQQRLGIAQALVGAPRLLMLDEPTSALDPVGRRIVRDLLAELRDRGVAVVLNSHLLSEVELVCDRVAILNGGRIVARGTPAELARPHGVEIQTGSGLQSFPDARRDEVPAIVAGLVGSGEQVYEVRLLTSTLEDAYLEAGGDPDAGGRGEWRTLVVADMPARVRPPPGDCGRARAHGGLPRPLRPRHGRGLRRGRRAERGEPAGRAGAHRVDPARPGDVHHSLPGRGAGRIPHARGGARRRRAGILQPLVVRPVGRTSLLLGRFAGAAVVCALYVAAVYLASLLITGLMGDWWPDSVLAPGLGLVAGVLVIAALSLLGSVFLSSTANGIAVFMLFGPAWPPGCSVRSATP